MNLLILLGVVSQLILVHSQSACNDFKTCGECIGYSSDRCVWCKQDAMSKDAPVRCRPQSEVYKDSKYDTNWCPDLHIYNPDSDEPEVIEDNAFNSTKGAEVQFRPQRIKLKLRPGVPVTFNMSYQPAKDYPLDMYFLMDNSYTMVKHAQELAKQTLKIYDALKKMTNNVQLGFGTFVEKPNLPYSDQRIHITYAFKHHLSLTENMTLFENMIKSYSDAHGSNYDSPEAGFDALMQVMKCKQIGWRIKSSSSKEQVQSRKIIMVATDATYHSAGDGKMIGAFKPNDMECHLNEEGFYKEHISQTLDYPSVSQISYVAKENKIKIVFAVLSNVTEVYKALVSEIVGADSVELKDDLIVKIIEQAYISASRNLELQIQHLPPSIKVETDCDKDPEKCKIIQGDPMVKISATVEAKDCKAVKSFDINAFGIVDKVTIDVEIDCECPCEKEKPAAKSADCHSSGFKQCGVCKCDPNRSGETCETECSGKEALDSMDKCKLPMDEYFCNNNGICECGKCKCNSTDTESYSGEFCQYDDARCRKSCPAEKGDCVRGECICKDDTIWTGPTCSCPVSSDTCIGPFSDKPCSGRGACQCGQCTCKSVSDQNYIGPFCESCNECAKEICEQLKEYAMCIYEQNTKSDCDTRFNKTSVQIVTMMKRSEMENDTSATGCRKELDNGNIIVYKYKVTKDDETGMAILELMIQDELEPPPYVNIWITIGWVIGGVLLVGLLTLIIWKIATDIYDKKEYEKFCKEAETAGFDVTNPVYMDPNVNFVNPAYCSAN